MAAVRIGTRYHRQRGQKVRRLCVRLPYHIVVRRAFKAVDVGEINLRRQEVDRPNSQIPLLLIMVSGSPVRPRIGSYRSRKTVSSARNGTRRRGR